ncbi:MAG: elongation factor P maturation arginine rhamnosyltransferase EarP [Betaproteobacteria bacterium]|nr:elongation factor P maturation arginine rhamnosyltransferase EarP [Betaproteobacteria bacterium]
MPASWHILCRVVDHYGDAGVCWRLARQLANEYDLDVTLFIDDAATLQRLIPALDTTQNRQRIDNVTVQRLTDTLTPPSSWPEVIVDAFGSGLPSTWLAALERDFPPLTATPKNANTPHWIVLEYLSAEPWIETMHGAASPPPSIELPRHFFFPGFTEASGGLLREKNLLDERDAFRSLEHFPDARRAFLERLGVEALPPEALLVSLFCYDTPALPALLDAWAASPSPIHCLLPETVAPKTVQQWRNTTTTRSALTLHTVPFLPQADFDRLLWCCDLNFVRGEDSFVRAQWAARPFVWQAYRQNEYAHLAKVDAFLQRYLADAPDALKTPLPDFTRVWNDERQTSRLADAWRSLAVQRPAFKKLARDWAQQLSAQTDLAQRLVTFCANREA